MCFMKVIFVENFKIFFYVVKIYKKQFFELDICMLIKFVVLIVEMFIMLFQKECQLELFQLVF